MSLERLQGETAVFTCSAMAEPIHSVRWEREGMVIAQFLSPDDHDSSVETFARLNSTQRNVSVINPAISNIQLAGLGASYGQLTIFNTSLVDAQNYTCTVHNVHGKRSATVILTLQGQPTLKLIYLMLKCTKLICKPSQITIDNGTMLQLLQSLKQFSQWITMPLLVAMLPSAVLLLVYLSQTSPGTRMGRR